MINRTLTGKYVVVFITIQKLIQEISTIISYNFILKK